jgi:hypothetical protein
MNVAKYSHPVKDAEDVGSHTSECIKSNTPFDLLSLLGNVVLAYFTKVHPLHMSLCSVLNSGRLVTISLRMLSAPWCK